MGENAPRHGTALRQIVKPHLPSPAGLVGGLPKIRALMEQGRNLVIEGEFEAGITQLSDAELLLLGRASLLASDQSLREMRREALLFLTQACLRTRQRERAAMLVQEAVRSFPDRDISRADFGPEIVQIYQQVRHELSRQPGGSLSISTTPPRSSVFVNERFVGLSPARLLGLHPGPYRVFVQGSSASRNQSCVHRVDVAAGAEHRVAIDLAYDEALQTPPNVGRRFADEKARQAKEITYAAQMGQTVGASTVLLVSFRHVQGRRALAGALLSSASGKVLRSAIVALEPTPPAFTTLKSFGHFLLHGGPAAPGVMIQKAELSLSLELTRMAL